MIVLLEKKTRLPGSVRIIVWQSKIGRLLLSLRHSVYVKEHVVLW